MFNLTVSRNERNAAANRDQTERDIALDNQQEATLQEDINRMSELLLDAHRPLRESAEGDEVRKIARVRTLTVLPRLNPIRKRSLLQFLYEAGLIDKGGCIVDLSEANLIGADLCRAKLVGAKLVGAKLIGANLEEADLRKANLEGAKLVGVNLEEADLCRAILSRANLIGANLEEADLRKAKLIGANLEEADISEANLSRANLSKANLERANLERADMSEANLSEANLEGAKLKGATGITNEELEKEAKSLKGATMPDGTMHP